MAKFCPGPFAQIWTPSPSIPGDFLAFPSVLFELRPKTLSSRTILTIFGYKYFEEIHYSNTLKIKFNMIRRQSFLLFLLTLFFIFLKNMGSSKFQFGKDGQVLRRPSPADPCLLKCKDEYMLSADPHSQHTPIMSSWRIDSAIGSPMHALVETAANENALERIGNECSHHSEFLTCLDQCGSSAAQQILIGGQETLKTICESYKNDVEFSNFVLSCLARNGPRIGRSCQLHWSLLEKDLFETMQNKVEMVKGEELEGQLAGGIQHLCRDMNSFADCHLKTVAQLCHRRALQFFVRLNAKSSASLLRMLVDWAGAHFHPKVSSWPECAQWDLSSNGGTPQKALAVPLFFFIHFILLFNCY